MDRKAIIFITILFLSNSTFKAKAQNLTNEGTDFWCGYTEMFDHANALFEINLSSRVNTSGTIEIPGYFTTPFNVTAGNVTNIPIPSNLANITTSEAIIDKGIHIMSNDPVAAFASTYHLYRSEATVLLPTSSLGSNYLVTTYKNFNQYESQFLIVCGSTPATVEITTPCNTEGNHFANTPWTVSLSPGEMYLVQAANGNTNDLTGSTITAVNGTDKFVVFNGHRFASVGLCNGSTKDPLYEIAFPVESMGKEYVVVKTEGQNQNAYRATAIYDNTNIYENGNPTPVATLMAGESYDALFTAIALSITGDKAFALTQSMTNANCSLNNAADPAMVMVNSNEQMYLDTATFFAVAYNGLNANYINVVTRTAETGLMQLNSSAIAGWNTVPGDPLRSYAIVPITPGSHTLTTTGCGFLAYSYGHQWAESYFYSAGARVNAIEDSISFTQYIGTNPNFCDVDTIEFTPYISGGTPVQYEWSFGDGSTSSQPNPIHVYNTDGDFPVELVVHFQCETDTILDTISIYHSPELVNTYSDITCFGFADGAVDVEVVNGGTGVMNYTWSNGATTEDVTGLGQGTYIVEVVDDVGCTDTDTIDIVEPAELIVNLTVNDPLCYINGTGSATVDNVIGGTGTVNYSWSSGGTSQTENGLTGGNYTVTVTDANSCSVTENFSITQALPVDVSLQDTVICQGGSADLVAVANGGAGAPYNLTWFENGNVLSGTNVNPVQNTCYQVIATDADNCPSITFDLCVDVHDLITASVTTQDICPGDMAELTSSYAGGDGNYTFDWQSQSISLGSNADLSYQQQSNSQEYCLTISDGCETPDVTICEIVDQYVIPTTDLQQQAGCPPFTASFDNVVDQNLVSSAYWDFGDGQTSTVIDPTVYYDYAGQYDVNVDFVSADGCPFSAQLISGVEVYDEVTASFVFEGNAPTITVEDTEVHFTNTSYNGSTYYWDFGDGNTSGNENPSHIYPDIGDRGYDVSLVVISAMGCTDEVQGFVYIEAVLLYFVPNAFTPDGDMFNDIFQPVFTEGYDAYDYHLTIFNKWGEVMFESYNADNGWDGTYGGDLVQDGVYIWQIEFGETGTDKRHTGRGHVTVLK